MNKFTLMLRTDEVSNLPMIGRFGRLLEFLATLEELEGPPAEAQFNDGTNLVVVATRLCLHRLQARLDDSGFGVTVAFTRQEGGCHDCDCDTELLAAE
jgi:hypothetical protein